jgi:hypothetical protein
MKSGHRAIKTVKPVLVPELLYGLSIKEGSDGGGGCLFRVTDFGRLDGVPWLSWAAVGDWFRRALGVRATGHCAVIFHGGFVASRVINPRGRRYARQV